jgi:hypothetical protein
VKNRVTRKKKDKHKNGPPKRHTLAEEFGHMILAPEYFSCEADVTDH